MGGAHARQARPANNEEEVNAELREQIVNDYSELLRKFNEYDNNSSMIKNGIVFGTALYQIFGSSTKNPKNLFDKLINKLMKVLISYVVSTNFQYIVLTKLYLKQWRAVTQRYLDTNNVTIGHYNEDLDALFNNYVNRITDGSSKIFFETLKTVFITFGTIFIVINSLRIGIKFKYYMSRKREFKSLKSSQKSLKDGHKNDRYQIPSILKGIILLICMSTGIALFSCFVGASITLPPILNTFQIHMKALTSRIIDRYADLDAREPRRHMPFFRPQYANQAAAIFRDAFQAAEQQRVEQQRTRIQTKLLAWREAYRVAQTSLDLRIRDNDQCPVCISSLVDPVKCPRCRSYVCSECILEWWKHSMTCPNCRGNQFGIRKNRRKSRNRRKSIDRKQQPQKIKRKSRRSTN